MVSTTDLVFGRGTFGCGFCQCLGSPTAEDEVPRGGVSHVHASVLQRRCAVLAGNELPYQDLLLGKWDGSDMQSALLAPGYVGPVSTTNPLVSRGLDPNVGQGNSLNPSDMVQQ